jgi:predicted  nucleic acid-binding Zn ribbon protein
MHVRHIRFSIPLNRDEEKVADFAYSLLSALRMNGQICGTEWPLHIQDDCCVATVMVPEHNSIAPEYHGKYVQKYLHEGEAQGILITSSDVGKECASGQACSCANPSAYILFTTFVSLESPLRCLDCFRPVPLYRLPATPAGEHCEIIGWQSDYQSCDRLQMNCTVLERAATHQISDLHSPLSQQGLAICQRLESMTNKPVYYYLYRASGRSLASEQKRLCPSCGHPWYQETPLHSLFHFKCERCRLLSNRAWKLASFTS